MHVAADLCTQAVDDLVQGLGAGGVHVDEELILVVVLPRRTGLDVRQVDPLLLQQTDFGESVWILTMFAGCSTEFAAPLEGTVLLKWGPLSTSGQSGFALSLCKLTQSQPGCTCIITAFRTYYFALVE